MQPKQPVTLGDWLALRDDMRAAELLLEDVQIDPADLAAYWAMSAELLSLLQDVEEYLEQRGAASSDDDAALYLSKRRRLVALLAKAQEIGIATAPEPE